MIILCARSKGTRKFGNTSIPTPAFGTKTAFMRSHPMSLETKRIKELFGYARTLTKEQGVGVMAARAAGFFKRRFFGKKARYLPAKQTLDTQRADAGQNAKNWPAISILTPLYNTPPQFLQQFLDSVITFARVLQLRSLCSFCEVFLGYMK